jgi:thiamine pyrophosphokinase
MAPTLTAKLIAADSGLLLADAHGAKVDLVVGDMDSGMLACLRSKKTRNDHFAFHMKNETDFELAVWLP